VNARCIHAIVVADQNSHVAPLEIKRERATCRRIAKLEVYSTAELVSHALNMMPGVTPAIATLVNIDG
jgi:hypothetical protein